MSEWVENGDIMRFTANYPDYNRIHLVSRQKNSLPRPTNCVHVAHRRRDRVGIPPRAWDRPWEPQRRELNTYCSACRDAEYQQASILVDSDYRARLADFGLVEVINESAAGSKINNSRIGGTTRWMAPELMYPEKFGFTRDRQAQLPSTGTDVYALGMTILEVRTLLSPLSCANKTEKNIWVGHHGMQSI